MTTDIKALAPHTPTNESATTSVLSADQGRDGAQPSTSADEHAQPTVSDSADPIHITCTEPDTSDKELNHQSDPADQDWEELVSSHFPIKWVQTAAENDLIYDRFGIDNEDDRALVDSISEHGIREPLVISWDDVLLSGHRRLSAAKYLGLSTVPVRRVDVFFKSLSKQERLAALRLHNQQREKSPGERIRESLLEVDADDAYRKLREKRAAAVSLATASKSNVDLGRVKVRPRITTMQFLGTVQRVIEENRPYWPLTDRRIHYLLLNNPPLRHDRKPKSTYANDHASYKSLTNLLVRARLTGDVPIECIEDSTRPIQLGGGFGSVQQFVKQETEDFLAGYSRNLMQGQMHHVEIVLEKNALRSIIEAVARDYCIPVTTGRGFSSLSPRYDVWRRYTESGKRKLILLMLTDFDPDGEEIAASFARSMRDDFDLADIHPIKVALTADHVREYRLPSDMDAKPSSPNYKKFIAKHGTKAVELDAAPVELLKTKLREAIESVIDTEEFNAQIAQETLDAAHLEAHRQVVLNAIGAVR